MTGITELVDLPDPDIRPLVHPLDVTAARRPFRTHYLIKTLTSPPVAVLAAGVLGLATQSFVGPAIAAASVIVFGTLASRHHREMAWAFIPRKRQDRQRPAPVSWQLAAGVLFSALLALALLLIADRLGQTDVRPEVRQYTFGMFAGAALLVVSGFLLDLVRYAPRRRILPTLPGVAAVAGCAIVSGHILFDTVQDATSNLVRAGVVTMVAVGAFVRTVEYVQHRRGQVRAGEPR